VIECLLASSKATRAAADEQLAFNNAKISFNSVEEGTLNFLAFKTNRMGKERSSEAERQAISRARQRISDAIFSVGNYSQQSLALYHALLHPDTRSVAKTAGFHSDANKAMRFQWKQLKEMLAVAMSTAKQKGRVNADEAAFVETILTAVAPDMTSEEAAPSAREYSELLGIPVRTARKGLKIGTIKRQRLKEAKASNSSTSWNKISRFCKGRSRVTAALREKVVAWVTNHENVIHSPIANDTLLIKSTVAGVTQKMRVGKLLCEFSIFANFTTLS
jgi:hypothetical protein